MQVRYDKETGTYAVPVFVDHLRDLISENKDQFFLSEHYLNERAIDGVIVTAVFDEHDVVTDGEILTQYNGGYLEIYIHAKTFMKLKGEIIKHFVDSMTSDQFLLCECINVVNGRTCSGITFHINV